MRMWINGTESGSLPGACVRMRASSPGAAAEYGGRRGVIDSVKFDERDSLRTSPRDYLKQVRLRPASHRKSNHHRNAATTS
jgi:hypothetical protein